MTFAALILVLVNSSLCLHLFKMKRAANSPFQAFYLLVLSLVTVPSVFDVFLDTVYFHPLAAPIQMSPLVVFEAHAIIFGMLAVLLLFETSIKTKALPRIDSAGRTFNLHAYKWVLLALLVSFPLGFFLIGSSSFRALTFENLREGPVGTFALWLFYLQILIIGLPAFFLIQRKNIANSALVLGLFAFIYLVLGGSRQVVIIAIASIAFVYLSPRGRRNELLLIAIFVFGFGFLDYFLGIVKLVRNTPGFGERMDLLVALATGQATQLVLGSENAIRFVMYSFLTEIQPDSFGRLQYLLRTLLFWLPSFLDFMSIKPADFEATMFVHVMGIPNGSMHATVFGSIYADAGIFSIVWLVFLFALMRITEAALIRISGTEFVMLWCTSIYMSVMICRGSLYAPTLVTALAIAIAIASQRFFTSNSSKQGRQFKRL